MRFPAILLASIALTLPVCGQNNAAGGAAPPVSANPTGTTEFKIADGDRVLFIGDVLLEREGTYGWLETVLSESFPKQHFTVRNLSWSGDTPRGVSRASFDAPEVGWTRLVEETNRLNPTVVFLGYGMAATLQEVTDRSGDIMLNPDPARYGRAPMTADRFKKEMGELMDTISENAKKSGNTAGVRFVLLAPVTHTDLRSIKPGFTNPTAHNALLAAYTKGLQELAHEKGARFVTPYDPASTAGSEAKSELLTANGIHLTPEGYHSFADHCARELALPAPTVLSKEAADALQQEIIRKNLLFFHRFRPENWTYLFGHRKHEQGQNAGEIPKFDPLVTEADAEIYAIKSGQATTAKSGALKEVDPVMVDDKMPLFDVQEGLQIELWATNPLLEKPIEMNWDADGRLWIASSNTYPQVNPEDVAATLAKRAAQANRDTPSIGDDRILVISDPGHTGKATKSEIFADGLLIPTGVAPYLDEKGRWSCFASASTELLELTDTDHNGDADARRIILSGFGTEDTHHILHTLRWGPDGRLFFDQSIYIHTHMETPWGVVRLNSGGIAAWDPRTEKVEVIFKGVCNPWGHVWDDYGQSFFTDGAGAQGISWGIVGAAYEPFEGARRLLQSISPGTYPKFCGLEIVHSPAFTDDWQGSFVTNDFRAHRIVHYGVNDLSLNSDAAAVKSGYVTKELKDIVRTTDDSFRPIDVKMGPDGAIYVADWSNPVINHGEVDFRDPRRDHHRGRIWRISMKGKAPLDWKPLSGSKPAELAAKLGSKNQWEKEAARALLQHAPAQQGIPADATVAQAFLDLGAGRVSPVLKEMLASKDSNLRATGARILGAYGASADPAILQKLPSAESETLLLTSAADANPRVRLEAMRSLARLQNPAAAGAILEAAQKIPAGDPYYEYAAWLSVNDVADVWTKALASGAWKPDSPEREKQLQYALNAIEPMYASQALSQYLATKKIPADGSGPWIDLISRAGNGQDLRVLFTALIKGELQPAASERAILALRETARLRNTKPDGDLSAVETLLANKNVKIAGSAARLIGTWKLPQAANTLAAVAAATKGTPAPMEERIAAVDGLRELGGDEAIKNLQGLLAPEKPLEIRSAALGSLAQLNLDAGVAAAGDVLSAITDEATALETWRSLLQIKGAIDAFAAKLPANLPPQVLTAGLRATREAGKNGEALDKTISAAMGGAGEKGAQDFHALAEKTKAHGDAARGELVFRNPQFACITCHAIGGAGGKVGPELTSMGASAPLDYVIESVVVPNSKVKEGFGAVSITLKDGTVATGIQVRETAQEIILRNVLGQETSVPKANIVSRETIGSIMPPGLTDSLPEASKLDLYAFLGELGRPGIYDASQGNVARYWALYPVASVKDGVPVATAVATPAYTLVNGALPQAMAAQAMQFMPDAKGGVAALARFHAPSAGPVTLTFSGAQECSIDGKPLAIDKGVMKTTLAAGEHTVMVKLDPAALPSSLKVSSSDVRFLGN